MISHFEGCHNAIWIHALKEFPNESCGVIRQNEYFPVDNYSEDKRNHFRLDSKDLIKYYRAGIDAVVHSHIDYPHLSKRDMTNQFNSNVPWGVAFINNGLKCGIHFWGESINQDLEGRPFIHGLYDCYSLVCDYYKKNFNMTLPFVPRKMEWWLDGESLIDLNLRRAGFEDVVIGSPLRNGDILLFKMKQKCLTHCMIYTGDATMIHHYFKRFSKYGSINRWVNKADLIVRHKEF